MTSLARKLAERWEVALLEELPGATSSHVYAGVDGSGREVVLKVPQTKSEERTSLPVLEAFSGVGGVEILRHDHDSGATLQKRVRPGWNLLTVSEDEAVEVCARTILRMRAAPMAPAIPLETWIKSLLNASEGPFVSEAKAIARRLLDSSPTETLLHGDLHHENVLRTREGWTFIDPKGLLGDPAYEVTAFMRNPLRIDLPTELIAKRLQSFATVLGDRIDRLWGWSFVEAVLNSVWAREDGEDPGRDLRRADALVHCRPQT